jgi:hypothetical protein
MGVVLVLELTQRMSVKWHVKMPCHVSGVNIKMLGGKEGNGCNTRIRLKNSYAYQKGYDW